MKTLIVHNHIPKNAGSFITKILKNEYKDKFHFAATVNDLEKVDLSRDILCLEIHQNNADEEFIKKFNEIRSHFDEVRLFTCLRHPIARITSGLRHARRNGGSFGFSPCLRLVRGPYEDFKYQNFKNSLNKGISYRYATPSASSVVDFILKNSSSDSLPQDIEFSVGQSLQFSLNNGKAVVPLNNQLREMVNKTNFSTFSPSFKDQFLGCLGAPAYEVVGVQERISVYVDKLVSSGIVSRKNVSLVGDAAVNKGLGSEYDFVEPNLALDFYLKVPIDFVLWGIFFEDD